ncbi:flagellar hook-basal body complex protein FliE [Aureimonas glaciei]|jgi:flagellar hook-basal body complex protein FliE|uniref:Flagellar hook-basal body complex protein FliE n=1 Tax=Aureimonas glaciei TaxID=1776957 RepID=A0A917DCS9_9HYPH|nr:flagellar hook-basal body complex protein FliE [Aureimonas glaciei]GGD27447.1 flagellar hook-basal body complex protein FliE [Aureimonas glaciei]
MIPAISSALSRVETSRIDSGMATGLSSGIGASGVGKPDFASVMAQVTTNAIDTMRNAEVVSVKGINGEASTQAVVSAVMDAERTLTTAVALRDKVVSAYQELSRMAI